VSAAGSQATTSVRVLRVLAPLGTLLMAGTIVLALRSGASLGAEGAAMGALMWGRVTFVDLALALVLGWAWIAWREASVPSALLWLVLTTITGSGAVLAYLAISAWRAEDMRGVLMGPHRAS